MRVDDRFAERQRGGGSVLGLVEVKTALDPICAPIKLNQRCVKVGYFPVLSI